MCKRTKTTWEICGHTIKNLVYECGAASKGGPCNITRQAFIVTMEECDDCRAWGRNKMAKDKSRVGSIKDEARGSGSRYESPGFGESSSYSSYSSRSGSDSRCTECPFPTPAAARSHRSSPYELEAYVPERGLALAGGSYYSSGRAETPALATARPLCSIGYELPADVPERSPAHRHSSHQSSSRRRGEGPALGPAPSPWGYDGYSVDSRTVFPSSGSDRISRNGSLHVTQSRRDAVDREWVREDERVVRWLEDS